jgi:membrane protein DedA with SNARE-associated domain
MPFSVAVLAATAGNLVGSLLAYGLGRAIAGRGRQLPGGKVLVNCGRLFDRHGSRAVFVARLMPLARTFVSLPAGHFRIPLPSFALLTTAGSAIWAAAFVSLGLLAGAGWASLSSEIGTWLLVLTGLVLVGAFLAHTARRRADLEATKPKVTGSNPVGRASAESCAVSSCAGPSRSAGSARRYG